MDCIELPKAFINLSLFLSILELNNGHEIFLYTKTTQFSAWWLLLLVRYFFYENESIDINTKVLP